MNCCRRCPLVLPSSSAFDDSSSSLKLFFESALTGRTFIRRRRRLRRPRSRVDETNAFAAVADTKNALRPRGGRGENTRREEQHHHHRRLRKKTSSSSRENTTTTTRRRRRRLCIGSKFFRRSMKRSRGSSPSERVSSAGKSAKIRCCERERRATPTIPSKEENHRDQQHSKELKANTTLIGGRNKSEPLHRIRDRIHPRRVLLSVRVRHRGLEEASSVSFRDAEEGRSWTTTTLKTTRAAGRRGETARKRKRKKRRRIRRGVVGVN